MKRIVIALYIALVCLTFSGCGKANQADELILIQSIGIDRYDNEYKITLQTYDTTNAEGKAVSSNVSENLKNIVTEGDTIYTALKNAEVKEGEKLFTGHNVVLILGSTIVKEDIKNVLDYFINDTLTFPGVKVVTTDGSALALLEIKNSGKLMSAINYDEILNRGEESSTVVRSDLIGLTNDVISDSKSAALPLIVAEYSSRSTLFAPKSTSIIKNGIQVGTLTKEETIGLNLLNGNAKQISLSVSNDNKLISVKLDNIKTSVKPEIIDGKVIMNTKIKYDIKQMEEVGQFKPQYLIDRQSIEKKVSQTVTEYCNMCADKVLKQYKADVLNIEKNLKFYESDYYKYSQLDYENMLSNVQYRYTIKSHIVN